MAHWLRWTRRLVKWTSIIISIAFLINSLNGIMSTIALADGEKIQQRPVQPGDFEINYENRTIDVGVIFNNTLFYDLDDILLHLKAVMAINRSKPSAHNITIINALNNETDPSKFSQVKGYSIKSGEAKEIGVHISGPDAVNMEAVFDYIGINPATWDVADLIQNPSLFGLLNTTFEIFLTVEFSVSYAYGQYKIDVELDFSPETFNLGLGI